MRIALLRVAQQLWLPVVLLVALWFATANSSSLYFPPLQSVLEQVKYQLTDGRMVADLGYSLTNLFAGYLIGCAVAIVAGLVIGQSERLHLATRGLLTYARAIPQLAFVPVLILALGIGAAPKIFAIALGTLWPVLLNTIQGVRGISPAVGETTRAYRIPPSLRLRKVTLPGASPQIFAGARVALAIAIIVTVVSEMYGSTKGIGFFVLQSGQRFAILDTWAGTLVIGVLGYVLSLLMLLVEHFSLGWYQRRTPRRGIRRRRAAAATPQLAKA